MQFHLHFDNSMWIIFEHRFRMHSRRFDYNHVMLMLLAEANGHNLVVFFLYAQVIAQSCSCCSLLFRCCCCWSWMYAAWYKVAIRFVQQNPLNYAWFGIQWYICGLSDHHLPLCVDVCAYRALTMISMDIFCAFSSSTIQIGCLMQWSKFIINK